MGTATPRPERSAPSAALRHPDFRWFQSARISSVLAGEMVAVAVAWQVYEITHRLASLGYIGLAQFLPSFLLFLIAGHTVDRFDRRRILLLVQSCYAVLALLLVAMTWSGLHRATPFYWVMLLQGAVRAFSGPAGQALMPQLVPLEDFANAVTWGSTSFQVALLVGPGAGGLIYGWLGPIGVYAIAAASYGSAVLCTWAIRTRTGRLEHRGASLETLFAGYRFVRDNPVIFGAISMDLFAVLLGGATALLPYFSDLLHAGVRGLGLLRGAASAGALLMALALAFRPIERKAGVTMMGCVAIFGVATIAFGLSRHFWFSLALLVVLGAADMVSVVVRQTLVQIKTPDAMRGRVGALNLLFIGTSNQLGEFESGMTGQWWGAVPATIVGGIGTLAVVAIWWVKLGARQESGVTSVRQPGGGRPCVPRSPRSGR